MLERRRRALTGAAARFAFHALKRIALERVPVGAVLATNLCDPIFARLTHRRARHATQQIDAYFPVFFAIGGVAEFSATQTLLGDVAFAEKLSGRTRKRIDAAVAFVFGDFGIARASNRPRENDCRDGDDSTDPNSPVPHGTYLSARSWPGARPSESRSVRARAGARTRHGPLP